MDLHRFIEVIEQQLHPRPYTGRAASLPEGIHLLLTVKRGIFGRYALAVTSWDATLDGQAFLQSRRRTLSRGLGALWALREVGLYLIVCGAQSQWRSQVAQMPADKTGLHALIVQAVHFVDPDTGETQLNQSAWGSLTFGGSDSIATVIDAAAASFSR